MTINTIQARVFDGPNADRVFDSAKYAYDKHNKVFVMFRVNILNPDGTSRLKGVALKARVKCKINKHLRIVTPSS